MQTISSTAHLIRREKRYLKHCKKEKLWTRFLIPKALCKVKVCSEYRIMTRTWWRKANKQVSNFYRGRMVEYRKCELPFRDIVHRNSQHPSTFMRIWNQRVLRVILNGSVACRFSNHYFCFLWQCSIERDGNYGASNDKTGYRNGTISSFQASFVSAYNILMAIYMSRGSEETAEKTLSYIRYWHTSPAFGVMVLAIIEQTTCTFLVRIDGSLNANWYIFYIFSTVIESYLTGLPNAIFR